MGDPVEDSRFHRWAGRGGERGAVGWGWSVRDIEIEPVERREYSVLLEAKKAQREKMQNMIVEQDVISLAPPSLPLLY